MRAFFAEAVTGAADAAASRASAHRKHSPAAAAPLDACWERRARASGSAACPLGETRRARPGAHQGGGRHPARERENVVKERLQSCRRQLDVGRGKLGLEDAAQQVACALTELVADTHAANASEGSGFACLAWVVLVCLRIRTGAFAPVVLSTAVW